MTDAEKLTMLQSICGDSEATSGMLTIYLDLAAEVIVHRAYPYLTSYILAEVPKRYDTLQVQIANEMYLHRGAEGETGHAENGVTRSYESGYVSDSLLKRIVPYGRVIGGLVPSTVEVIAEVGFASLAVGEVGEISVYTEVTCTDGTVKDVTEGYDYSSSDESILTVSDGNITGVSSGTATITITGHKSEETATLNVTIV